ncbi:MAG: hypothetical protein L3V56_04420 [Candidatus Magnetoovum sp. WYHC-5]|nr:hypothetical protein [Candidatus Magnetoovum sp. WYHC-5]
MCKTIKVRFVGGTIIEVNEELNIPEGSEVVINYIEQSKEGVLNPENRKWMQVAKKMSKGLLTGEAGEEFARLSKGFRDNFIMKNPFDAQND